MHLRTVLLLGLVLPLAANGQQARNPAPQRGQSPHSTASGPITIRGCIQGGRERYTLTQQSTAATFELEGDPQRFQSMRGKPVEVTAREAPPSHNAGRNDLPRLLVDEVQAIQGQCPFVEGSNVGQPSASPVTIPGTPNTSTTHNAPPTAATPRYGSPGAPKQTPPSVGNNPNVQGASGAPSPGTGNPPPKPSSPPPQ